MNGINALAALSASALSEGYKPAQAEWEFIPCRKFIPSHKPLAKTRLQSIGRNAPCPCGSGKKFKRCCMNDQFRGVTKMVNHIPGAGQKEKK
jgi:hypothetical protein